MLILNIIKEITYIFTEGYSSSALKHGPFALLDENVPVIIISPNNEYFAKNYNAYQEIKSRNSPILVQSFDGHHPHDIISLLPVF